MVLSLTKVALNAHPRILHIASDSAVNFRDLLRPVPGSAHTLEIFPPDYGSYGALTNALVQSIDTETTDILFPNLKTIVVFGHSFDSHLHDVLKSRQLLNRKIATLSI